MKRHSVRNNIIKMLIVFMCAITIVFGWLFYREKQDETRRIKDDEYGQYIVELNEVKQLYDSGSTDADGKLDAVMDELREQKIETDKSGLRNIVIMYIVVLCIVIALFLYIYVSILRPFDELEDYASHLAAGDMDTELKYRRVNMFGSFTWAFDHMRTEIMHARRREQEAIENNKTVIATLSHDIKTPIASIRGYAEALVMNMDATQERRERYASVIMKKCDEVTSITNDMFIHSLHDLDRLAVKSDEVEIKPLLEQVLSDIGLGMDIVVNGAANGEANVDTDGHNIGTCSGDITWAVLEHADSGRVVQVIENILSNASKYARDTEISITTGYIKPEELPRNVHVGGADMVYRLSIKDHGTGIPDKDMPFIYEKFYRGENSGDEPGAGLGLFIVRYLMDRMGGDVELVNHTDGLEAVLYFAARKVC